MSRPSPVRSDGVQAVAGDLDVARQFLHHFADQISSALRSIVGHQLQLPQRGVLERREVAGAGLELVVNLRQPPQELETDGIGVTGWYGQGAALPRLKNRAQASFIAERVR